MLFLRKPQGILSSVPKALDQHSNMVTKGRLPTAQSANHPPCLLLPQHISLPLRDNRLSPVLGRTISIRESRLLVLHQVKISTSRLRCMGMSHRGLRVGSGGLQLRRPQYRGNRTTVPRLQYLEPIAEERLIKIILMKFNEFTNINMPLPQSSPQSSTCNTWRKRLDR